MGLFSKQVVVLKESSGAREYLKQLEELLPKVSGDLRERVEKDIMMTKAGIAGEDRVMFELKNSGMDMYVLQDIMLIDGPLSAQIDFFVVTPKLNFIIECKNLYGNIEINSKGDFIRTTTFKGKRIKEGIYSPITQNERHLQIMKDIQIKENSGLAKVAKAKFFDNWNRSLVVLANPKTVVNDRYAKREVKEQVIRVDQLITVIKKICNESHEFPSSMNQMEEIAMNMLKRNVAERKDYSEKYQTLIDESMQMSSNNPAPKMDRKDKKSDLSESSTKETDSRENGAKEKQDTVSEQDNEVKQNAVSNIKDEEKSGSVSKKENEQKEEAVLEKETQNRICPRCGAPLVLRTAKKGDHAGNQFWGCSAFPKCRYISNT